MMQEMEKFLQNIEQDMKNAASKMENRTIFTDNETFLEICTNISSIKRKNDRGNILMMNWLEEFWYFEGMSSVSPKLFAEHVDKMLNTRFVKIDESLMTLTSQSFRKAFNYIKSQKYQFTNSKSGNQESGDYNAAMINLFEKMCKKGELVIKEEEFKNYYCCYDIGKYKSSLSDKMIQLKLFLQAFFVMCSIWSYIGELANRIGHPYSEFTSEYNSTVKEFAQLHLIDVCFTNKQHQTLYHILTAFGFAQAFETLANLDNDIGKYKDENGEVLYLCTVH